MLFAEIAAVSAAVAATSKRREKTELFAELIRRLERDEIEPAIGFLSGELRQGRIGTSWRSLAAIDATPAAEPVVTILEVDATLTEVQATSGTGSVAARASLLKALFERSTLAEYEMIRALLSGGVRQGALAGVVSDGVAKAAGVKLAAVRRAAMLCGDLGVAAAIALTEGGVGLDAVQLSVGVPVQPMLASTAGSVTDALGSLGGDVSIEWKLDGARIQVHRWGDQVRIYTRNLNDVTDRLPEVVGVVEDLPVDSVVLDGETLALDADARPQAFQNTMSRFGRDEETGWETSLLPWFFDLLYVDGRSIIDEPLSRRRQMLESIAADHCVPALLTRDVDAAREVERAALDAGHEGVMVKSADSPYEAGRRGKAWLKVKPVHTLDLVVLGAEWGHGRRTGSLSNLHLGARDPEAGGFIMVGKTFKGLTDELLAWQTEQFLARETHRDGITVFVRPELVVEIAVDGVQTSTRYAGGVALRFARVKAYRNDKSPDETDTIDTVRSMRAGS